MNKCFVVATLWLPLLASAEQYLCVPVKATGFQYVAATRSWEEVTFKTDHKYVVSPSNAIKGSQFKVKEVGNRSASLWCRPRQPGFLECSGVDEVFRINKISGRYVRSSSSGYYSVGMKGVIESDADSPTPMIEIGKCSSF